MKKFFLSFSALLIVGASVFAVNPPETNPRVMEAFKKEFSSAEQVKWSIEGNYNQASFVLGGSRAIAFFDQEGQLLGSVRDILYNQLPLAIIKTLDREYNNYAVFEIRELTNQETGTRYKIVVEGKNKKYRLTLTPDGSTEEITRIKK
jgi:hypothetical protein